MKINPGSRLGGYEVLSTIGAGGMGEVYRARDTRLKREVALKVLPVSFTSDLHRLARFQREAEVLAALNHPNIAQIYGIEDGGDTPALVLELVDGLTLAESIKQSRVSVAEAVAIARQIAYALQAAHGQGVVHRDLKPANIKVRSDGTVKVLDFGLAKLADSGSSLADATHLSTTAEGLTAAGVIMGTASYMAPEQASGKPVDKRIDVWAFGCVLYEMLTGHRAFAGETFAETISTVLRGTPDWSLLPPDTPRNLRRLLRRCFEKDPSQRLHDIADARIELDDEDNESLTQSRSTSRGGWELWFVGLAALASGAAAMQLIGPLVSRSPSPLLSTELRFEIPTPPVDDRSSAFSFALSADGRRLAFVARHEKVSRLWIRSLADVTTRVLPRSDGAVLPFWSPDGSAIGFFADGKLKRIDVDSGEVQELADAPAGRGGSWNNDNVIVFAPTGASALFRVAATGGSAERVTEVSREQQSHRSPQFLPDGRRFLFHAYLGSASGLYLGTLNGVAPRRLVPDGPSASASFAGFYAAPDSIIRIGSDGVLSAVRFDPEREEVTGDPIPLIHGVGADVGLARGAFAVSASGVLAHRTQWTEAGQLLWIDRSGAPKGVVMTAEVSLGSPELSADGRFVALQRVQRGSRDLWLIELATGNARNLTADSPDDGSPVWSPDGTRVAFRSWPRGGHNFFNLWVKPSSGAGVEQELFVNDTVKNPQDWSSDGRHLLYASLDSNTGTDFWALPLDGDRQPFAVVKTPDEEGGAQFSPDGRWVAYASNDGGRSQVFVRPFRGPDVRWLVSAGGGSQVRWHPDGKELFYVAPDNRLMAVTVNAKGETFEHGVPSPLFVTDLLPTAPLALEWKARYDVAREGAFLMNIATDAPAPPITIVVNSSMRR